MLSIPKKMSAPTWGQLLRSVARGTCRNTTFQSSIPRQVYRRSLSTTSRTRQDEHQTTDLSSQSQPDFQAAPPIPFGDGFTPSKEDINLESKFDPENPNDHDIPLMKRIRIVPDSPSYFSARPKFTDAYLIVEEHYLRWKLLPKAEHPPHILWHDFESLKAQTGNEPISETRYRALVKMLKELSAIEPVLMPPDVAQMLNGFKRAYQPALVKPKEFFVDEWGRSLGVGKRKSSTAKVYLVMGEGKIMVNGKNLTEYFTRLHDRESSLWPLKITERLDKYNVFAVVGGGGSTGQAEALTLAVARALLVHEPTLHTRLLEGKLPLTRIIEHTSSRQNKHKLTNFASRLSIPRSTSCREEKGRTSKGPQEASLGQALESARILSIYSLITLLISEPTSMIGRCVIMQQS